MAKSGQFHAKYNYLKNRFFFSGFYCSTIDMAHSFRKSRVPGSSAWHILEPFFISVCGNIPLASGFHISSYLLSLFLSNRGKLKIHHILHANFFSFLIFHELESTDISTPQQLPVRSPHIYSFSSFQLRLEMLFCDKSFSVHVNISINKFVGPNVSQKPEQKFCIIMLITHVSILLTWDVRWFNFVRRHCWTNSVR